MSAPSSTLTMALDGLKGGSGYLKAKIGGFDCYVLVDTGASRSVIPKHLWLSITKGGCALADYPGKATAVNGGDAYYGVLAGCLST